MTKIAADDSTTPFIVRDPNDMNNPHAFLANITRPVPSARLARGDVTAKSQLAAAASIMAGNVSTPRKEKLEAQRRGEYQVGANLWHC